MVDEGAALFSEHDDEIGSVDLLGAGPGSPFTDDIADGRHDDNLGNIFDEDNLPSLNSPLESPPRSTNSSVSVEPGANTPPRGNGGNAAQLGLPQNKLEDADWRDDDTDLRARKEVLLQIVKILHARKANPTTKWLKDLPYKARKLEEQLYQGAPNLEDYSDKRTLKHRLKRVARDIKSRYRACLNGSPKKSPVKPKLSSARSSDSQSRKSLDEEKQPSKPSVSFRHPAQSSHASDLASLQSLLNEQQKTPSRRPSLSNVTPSNLSSLRQSMMTPEDYRMGRRPSSSIVTPRNAATPSIASELAALQAMQNNLQRSRQQPRLSMNGRTNADIAALLGSNDGNIHPARISNQEIRRRTSLPPNAVDHHIQQQQQQRRLSSGRQETVEDQQAANQKLQQQILENIRQQQVLMRELMDGNNGTSSLRRGSNGGNHSSTMPTRLNIANSSVGRNNSSASQFAQAMLLNSNKADRLLSGGGGGRRQLPMDLLQQSLTRNNSNMVQQQRRNSNGMNPSMPRPDRDSFLNGLQDHLSPSTFNW